MNTIFLVGLLKSVLWGIHVYYVYGDVHVVQCQYHVHGQHWQSQVGAKPPHQRSQPLPSPATQAGILSVSLRSAWGGMLACIQQVVVMYM